MYRFRINKTSPIRRCYKDLWQEHIGSGRSTLPSGINHGVTPIHSGGSPSWKPLFRNLLKLTKTKTSKFHPRGTQ